MDTAKKQDLLNQNAEQYKTKDAAKKQDQLNEKAKQFCNWYDNQGLNR